MSELSGLRDRALLAVMVYSFARVSAAIGMNVEDYYPDFRSWRPSTGLSALFSAEASKRSGLQTEHAGREDFRLDLDSGRWLFGQRELELMQ